MTRPSDFAFFRLLARSASFTDAARSLSMTPSAVSRRLHAIESRLGTELVLRNTRSMRLTPQGERYLEAAETILRETERLEADIASRPKASRKRPHSLRVARLFGNERAASSALGPRAPSAHRNRRGRKHGRPLDPHPPKDEEGGEPRRRSGSAKQLGLGRARLVSRRTRDRSAKPLARGGASRRRKSRRSPSRLAHAGRRLRLLRGEKAFRPASRLSRRACRTF